MDWFVVDKKGLAAQVERMGKERAVVELFSNGLDANGVTRVDIVLEPSDVRGYSWLTVTDDSPDGFSDLTDSYTVFGKSDRIHDAEKRGRFSFGEKIVLSLCREAEIVSTLGGVRFTEAGRQRIRRRRDAGTQFKALIRLNASEREQVARLFATVLPPVGVTATFNGQIIDPRTPVLAFTATLRSEIADSDGVLRPTRRLTSIRLFDPAPGETPHLYELGIPVVEYDGKWHADIGQKVPLSIDRTNVTPAYLRDVHVAILNAAHHLLTGDDAVAGWVKDAMESPHVSSDSVKTVVTCRFGDKAVIADPSDPESNNLAALRGFTVVHGGALSKKEWANVKRDDALLPSSKVTPAPKVQTSADGKPPIPPDKWTPGMQAVAEYAEAMGRFLLNVPVSVEFHSLTQYFAAAYGSRTLTFNLFRLGHAWFDKPVQEKVDALLLHEFAHERVGNHLSEEFHDEVARLGARLRQFPDVIPAIPA